MNKWLPLIPRAIISGLFFHSGWIKIQDLSAFAAAMDGYQLLPERLLLPFSAVLPWLEIWCAVALWITPPFRRSAWIWIQLLLLIFTAAKISVLMRGMEISCGCSGSEEPLTWSGVGINLIWLAFGAAGWRWDRRGRS
ncbi:MAG: MauE/DoxX family redox-associated membrane protein [Kiritimatiellia bacterium]